MQIRLPSSERAMTKNMVVLHVEILIEISIFHSLIISYMKITNYLLFIFSNSSFRKVGLN